MKILAVSPVMPTEGCQPIKPEFAGKKQKKIHPVSDKYTPSDSVVLEQKYNFACRLAAYYKTQYEKLLHSGKCLA